ncbi:MAG TPA: CBS domain-containing protein [Gaiellaceae bacterium]|nr:CBS domain-containing protein [Gaiellaceae bacterium]
MKDEQLVLDETTVADAMHQGVLTCGLYAPLTQVARTMAEENVHCVVVWNEPSEAAETPLWGVVSDLDLVAVAASENLRDRTAGGSANTPVLMVATSEPLRRAAQMMAEHEVSHLVAVDPLTTKPVGVVSTLDIARALSGVTEPVPVA